MTDVYDAINEFGKLVGSKNQASANVFYRWQELRPVIEALQAERDALWEQLDAARQALGYALECKGPYNGTVSERGGYPALCHNCAERVRAALGVEGRDE